MDETRPNASVTRPSPSMTVKTAVASTAKPLWLIWIAVPIFALGILFALGGYALFQASTLIAPGVRVGDMPVGWMSHQTAVQELERVWNEEYTISVVDSSDMARSWVASPSEFGLTVDAEGTAEAALTVGRTGNLFLNLGQIWTALWRGYQVAPEITLDPNRALAGMQSWAARVDVQPVDAQLEVENGQASWVGAQPGKAVDVLASLDFLRSDLQAAYLENRAVALIMLAVEPGIEDVSGALTELESLLDASPSLQLYDPVRDEWLSWTPLPETYINWISIEPAGATYRVEVMPQAVENYVENQILSLGEERTVDSRLAAENLMVEMQGGSASALIIHYLPRRHTVRPGDNLVSLSFEYGVPYWKIYEANPDLVVGGLPVGGEIEIPPRDAMLDLPVVPNKRIVISISQQHMWVYEDQQLISEHVISTGIADSPTMPGIFQVLTHEENAYASIWDLYMPHFMGIYYATPDLLNGIHGLPLLSSGRRLWADVLGRPASYGCIILDLQAAEQLFYWADAGVVVEIQR